MSVLIADYTLVIRKQALDEKYPGGAASYVEALQRLEVPPRFVCSADPHLVNACYATPDGIAKACIWSSMLGIVAHAAAGMPDLACVDQIVGPDGECDWLAWRRDSSEVTSAWLAGTEPGEMAAPDGWVPREHCVIEETLAQAQAEAHARRTTFETVCATLDQLECEYTRRHGETVAFTAESEKETYVVSILVGAEGLVSCTCAPVVPRALRHVAKLAALLKAANREAARFTPRLVFQLAEIDGRIACCALFVPDELTVPMMEFVIGATLDLADDVQAALTPWRKSA